jgi:hypothetical protein
MPSSRLVSSTLDKQAGVKRRRHGQVEPLTEPLAKPSSDNDWGIALHTAAQVMAAGRGETVKCGWPPA